MISHYNPFFIPGICRIALGGCLIASPAFLHGQDPTGGEIHELSAFEVTGTRLAFPAFSAGKGWRVDGIGDSPETRPPDTWSALERLPGLHVEQPGGLGGNPVLYLRGGEPNFTKVLVDGIEVVNTNSSRGGTYNFNALSLSGIFDLEVMAGAQSAIYGSDALSGVIRIATMPMTIPEPGARLDLELQVGELDYLQAGSRFGIAGKKHHLSGSLNRLEESIDQTGESFEAWRGTTGLVFRSGPRARFFVSALGSEIDRRHYPDDSGGWRFAEQDALERNQSKDRGSQVSGQFQLAPSMELITRVSWYRLEEMDQSPGVLPGQRDPFGIPASTFDSRLVRYQAQSYVRHEIMPRLAVVFGGGLLDESGRSDSLVQYPFGEMTGQYDLQRTTKSLFGEAAVHLFPNHRADLAVRWDDIDETGRVLTNRFIYRVAFPDYGTQVRMAYGEGFKNPSFFALGNPVVGNPDLRPEESDLLELELAWQSEDGLLSSTLTLAHQEYTNLIDFSESGPPRLVNLQSVTSRSATAAVRLAHGRIDELSLHATYLDLEVEDSDELLRNRPEWKFGLSLKLQLLESLYLDFTALHIGERKDSSIPTGNLTLESYQVSDLGLRWRIQEGFWMLLAVENLWNSAYEATIGMPDPGRRFRTGIRCSF